MANSVNGMARARANAPIPRAGPLISPFDAASTSRVPISGPVHENDTSTSVNAIRNILIIPVVRSALLSTLLLHFAGSFMSNAPKNEMANTTRIAKNIRLNTALVARSLSLLAPNIPVTASPSTRYITMIARPYVIASNIDCFREVFFLRKKLTVRGIIGQTHGVRSASRPPTNPHIIMYHQFEFTVFSLHFTGVHHCDSSSCSEVSDSTTGVAATVGLRSDSSSFTV